MVCVMLLERHLMATFVYTSSVSPKNNSWTEVIGCCVSDIIFDTARERREGVKKQEEKKAKSD